MRKRNYILEHFKEKRFKEITTIYINNKMKDTESVVTIDYNVEREIEYGRKLIYDDIKKL